MENIYSAEVVIIGGGIAGVSAALKISDHTHVTLIEKKQLFWGSSGRNPGRMGHGFHYIDIDTARLYLRSSVAVQRNYPDFLIGKDLPFEHPIRHGRYFVTKDSLFNFEKVMQTYRLLQEEYVQLIHEDPANEVFGPPDQFLKVLKPQEYQDYVNADIVEGAVETAEHLFNWSAFASHIRSVIETHPRIRLIENSEVTHITPRVSKDVRFALHVTQNQDDFPESLNLRIHTNFIINSAWENIDFLNESAGVRYLNRMRTNRLKCLLEVELPPFLHQVNSSFFCMGAFCMFSNMGNGRGMMTLADVTNMASSYAVKIDANMERYVRGDVSLEEKLGFAHEIIAGVSKYIPAMADARFIDVKFGIVQTQGELNLSDLLDPKAAHHVRNYHGIREEYQGLISNPAMKLFYFVEKNGRLVDEFFRKQRLREVKHQQVYSLLMESPLFPWRTIFRNDFHRAIYFMIDRMMLDDEDDPRTIVDNMSRTMLVKLSFHQHLSLVRQRVRIFLQWFPTSIHQIIDDFYSTPIPDEIPNEPIVPIRVKSASPKINSYGIFGTVELSRSHSYSSSVKIKDSSSATFFRPISAHTLETLLPPDEVKSRPNSTNSFSFALYEESKDVFYFEDSIFPPSPRH